MGEWNEFGAGEQVRRPLPLEAAYLLGVHAREEGFVQFLVDAAEDGFVLEHPDDADLADDERREIVISRARVITNAWTIYRDREATT